MYCQTMLERGMEHGMDPSDLWFDPLFLVINGMPKHIRPIMDAAMVAMAMQCGLTSAIVNPNDLRLMETIKSCDIIKNNTLYADSYLEL